MDQLFYIGTTLTGFGWADLLSLTDQDRLAIIARCNERNERQNDEIDKLKSKMR